MFNCFSKKIFLDVLGSIDVVALVKIIFECFELY